MLNRASATGKLLQRMKELDTSGRHYEFYNDVLPKMSNEEFKLFIDGIVSGKNPLFVNVPNYDEVTGITVDNNIEMAKRMGYDFYQRIWVTDPVTGVEFLTPLKHLVYDSTVCRQTQTIDDKISVPKNNKSIDNTTGQPAGDSRSAQCSGPEFMILNSVGLEAPIMELMKYRGGDNVSRRYTENMIIKTGAASMYATPGASLRPTRSVKTLSIILNGMGFANNFAG
jgi:hypothetical protein